MKVLFLKYANQEEGSGLLQLKTAVKNLFVLTET